MERIGPDLFRLRTGGFAAPHLIMADIPTLVDAGGPGRGPAVEREIEQAGIRIGRIILTHGDPDHIGGTDHLRRATGAEVCASHLERPMIDRTGWPALPRLRRLLLRAFFRGTTAPRIDRWLVGDEDLRGIQIHATPGHTPGHVALSWQRWLVVGDAFVTGDRFRASPWPFNLDPVAARISVEALLTLDPVGASSAHGRPADSAAQRLHALVATWS